MKKLLSTMLIAVLAIFMLGTISNATTKAELKNYILSEKTIAGKTYVIRDADKVKLEKLFANNDVTDEQATKVKEIAEKALNYMSENGASSPDELKTKAQKQQLLAYAQEAASVLGLTVNYDTSAKRLDVYRDGKFIDSFSWGVLKTTDSTGTTKTVVTTEPKLGKTGATNYIYAIAAGLVLIAGTTLVIARKKNASINA
ncbi:MAG: LPXTG cell wall anchor domain-containing protein [Clostridia bacterium]|nr:LPXTG cell wall anchor domain-containing protein [Clostridia bacterium]